MVFGGFFKRLQSRRRRRIATVRRISDLLNAMEQDDARPLFSPDLIVVDGAGRRIEGVDDFLLADRNLRIAAGHAQVRIHDISVSDNEVFVSGTTDSESEEMSGQTFWRLTFDGEIVSEIHIVRDPELMTVARYHAKQRR
jgi:hypothetical protein